MLVIRLQRTGRKGHAQFRVVVQDSRRTPSSGKVVAALGHYNPHTKEVVVNKEKAEFYMEHGAQPTSRIAMLFKKEGIKLPDWVKIDQSKTRTVRNAEKRRSTAPAPEVEEVEEVAEPAEEKPAIEEAPEAEATETAEPAEEKTTE